MMDISMSMWRICRFHYSTCLATVSAHCVTGNSHTAFQILTAMAVREGNHLLTQVSFYWSALEPQGAYGVYSGQKEREVPGSNFIMVNIMNAHTWGGAEAIWQTSPCLLGHSRGACLPPELGVNSWPILWLFFHAPYPHMTNACWSQLVAWHTLPGIHQASHSWPMPLVWSPCLLGCQLWDRHCNHGWQVLVSMVPCVWVEFRWTWHCMGRGHWFWIIGLDIAQIWWQGLQYQSFWGQLNSCQWLVEWEEP